MLPDCESQLQPRLYSEQRRHSNLLKRFPALRLCLNGHKTCDRRKTKAPAPAVHTRRRTGLGDGGWSLLRGRKCEMMGNFNGAGSYCLLVQGAAGLVDLAHRLRPRPSEGILGMVSRDVRQGLLRQHSTQQRNLFHSLRSWQTWR